MDTRLALEGIRAAESVIDGLSRERAALPNEIASAENAAQSARDQIEGERKRIEALEHARREKEIAIQDIQERRRKYQGQTAQVKTNQEYTALLHEIEGTERRIAELEEDVLAALEEIEQRSESLRALEDEQGRMALEKDEHAARLRTRLAEVERELEFQSGQRAALASDLPPDLAARYQRVFKVRGSGIAVVRGQTCSACHRNVPPETINRIRAGEVHICASCQRVLTLADASA